MAKKNARTCNLTTPFEDNYELDWAKEYPRPQLKRDSFISLCGEWDLSVKENDLENALGKITVPYPPESRISGINRQLGKNEQYIYHKNFDIDENFEGKKVILRFGAVDQQCEVYINGKPVGGHTGGYLPFSFDITEFVTPANNEIVVEVTDKLDIELSYGKQCKKRGGMWYTPISGIWQPVWLEIVPQNAVEKLKIISDLDSVTIETVGGAAEKSLEIETFDGKIIKKYNGDSITVTIDNPINWTPENPYLYNFTLTCGEDKIQSYFALRTVTIEKVKGQSYICLNGKPYFFHGLLDQGYYSDGIYTPKSPDGFVWDILEMKKLGFNMLRKHIKVEPDLFYYYCDKYGMAVFQDMLNSGKYHYIIDTILPTIGMRRGVTHKPSKVRKNSFEAECREITEHLYNHPSVCYYTIFNEGWGQYDADRIYKELKAIDPSRVWDSTSGWFKENDSDVDSEHIYFGKMKLNARPQRPLVLSEFGGYSYKVENHSFNLDDNYGYKTFTSAEGLTKGLVELFDKDIIPAAAKGLNATVLTQVSDVEDETNGMATYDRKVIKVDANAMTDMAQRLFNAFKKATE